MDKFERSRSDFIVFLRNGVGVHAAIMHNRPIKEPWPTLEDMGSIHGHNMTPHIIPAILPNG